ncbi:MAG: HAD-IA family hydrolase [Kiritimatiellaeota bacterium]|nr:HAD-IA family hydrolase [Kiritimatiellota bacterium]
MKHEVVEMPAIFTGMDAILFDMDGVLCDSEAFIAGAAAQMLAETYNIAPTRKDFAPFVGTGEDRFISGAAAAFGVTVTLPRDKDRTYAIYLELIKGRLQPLPGVHDFIRLAHERGLRLAVASSADEIKVHANLREIGLPLSTFGAIVCGKDVEHKKPAPDIFLTAARRLGVDPRRALVIEDAVTGVQAATAAGCPSIGITSTFSAAELAAAGARLTAADLSQFTS